MDFCFHRSWISVFTKSGFLFSQILDFCFHETWIPVSLPLYLIVQAPRYLYVPTCTYLPVRTYLYVHVSTCTYLPSKLTLCCVTYMSFTRIVI
eukprot:SAG11_NODE_363_length_10162_cov_28.285004_4_plen_93_part_00